MYSWWISDSQEALEASLGVKMGLGSVWVEPEEAWGEAVDVKRPRGKVGGWEEKEGGRRRMRRRSSVLCS